MKQIIRLKPLLRWNESTPRIRQDELRSLLMIKTQGFEDCKDLVAGVKCS